MARILIIEDNPANLDLMSYLLSAFGHTPLTAQDGEAGLEVARREAPDIIICDIQLPKIDGMEVARQLKDDAALRATPLVAVTALAMVGDRDRMLAAGFDGYIPKPIVPETFVSQVEMFLDPAAHSSFEPHAEPAAPPVAAPAPAYRATILVVDDTAINRDLMRSMLEPSGYTVLVAHDVGVALALAERHMPDLIVSDLHMPGQDGFALISAIRDDPRLRQIKIVIHSATIMSDRDRYRALELGADRFLARPMEPQVILDAVEACLREPPKHQPPEA